MSSQELKKTLSLVEISSQAKGKEINASSAQDALAETKEEETSAC
jgi:hypothetical protein